MLNRSAIVRGIADMCRLFTVALLVPVAIALLMEPWDFPMFGVYLPFNALAFLAAAAICTIFWVIGRSFTSEAHDETKLDREGYLAVGLGWLVLTFFAALPFLFSGVMKHPMDAWFEAMSGITTTGASVLPIAPEDVPASVLFWRALLQWMGGLGIVVLLVALLANLTQGGFALMKAEAGAHAESRLRPKITDTAKVLGKVYIVISAFMAAVLFLLMLRIGMSPGEALFDGVYHTFTTYSTGGFSSHADSIAFYDDWAIEAALIVFMFVGATQFLFFMPEARGRIMELLHDAQWRFMMGLALAASVAVAVLLVWYGDGVLFSIRAATFAVTTALTGTGHASHDFGIWPQPLLIVLLMLMLTGGNAGSTSGGIKSGRMVLLAKTVKVEMVKLLHPRAVVPVRMGGRPVDEDTVRRAVAFFFAYISIWAFSAIIIAVLEPGMGVVDAASAAVAGLGNVGVGLGSVGPGGSFATLTPASKGLISMLMWVGRLEIFTAVLIFYPQAWKN